MARTGDNQGKISVRLAAWDPWQQPLRRPAPTTRTIEAFWQKVQLLKSCGVDPEDGFALEKFEELIRQGGALAQRYLRIYDDYRDKTPPGDGGTPPVRRH